jgi:hypothetical protein
MDIKKRIEELKQEISKLEDEINEGQYGDNQLGELGHLLQDLKQLEEKDKFPIKKEKSA